MKFHNIKLLFVAVLGLLFQRLDAQTFELNSEVSQRIDQEIHNLNELKDQICAHIDKLSSNVSVNGDGSLNYPNWVSFVQTAEVIDSLNVVWNESYGQALDNIIEIAIATNSTDVDSEDERGKDLLADIIEENHLIFEEDVASVCFEEKFNFNSLRKCLKKEEEEWLENITEENFNPGKSPTFAEEIYDEEYWTLITCDKTFAIENTDVESSMLDGKTEEEQTEILTTIKEIVDILGSIVKIAEDLHGLFADCGGTTSISDKNYKNGIQVPYESSWIGYYIIQKGQAIDFANRTITKIKGKARLYKEKSDGNRKRDRRNRASIGFCAKEWNNCESRDWPSDPWSYVAPYQDGPRGGRAKVKHREPKALTIEYSYHFLQFKFGKNGIFAGAYNLLGNTGCSHASNTEW